MLVAPGEVVGERIVVQVTERCLSRLFAQNVRIYVYPTTEGNAG
jgi:hypothetical protein